MPLFKRRARTEELVDIHVEIETWTKRLVRVGTALDSLENEVRDVVVIAEGDESARGEVISLLGYRQSTFVAGWSSLMYRLSSNRESLVLIGEDGIHTLNEHAEPSVWHKLMRGVGILLDAIPAQLSSPTVVLLPSGVVVNALTAEFNQEGGYALRSYALSNDQINGALLHESAAHGQPARPPVRST